MKPRRTLVRNIRLYPLVSYHTIRDFQGYRVASHRHPAYLANLKRKKRVMYLLKPSSKLQNRKSLIKNVMQHSVREFEDHPLELKVQHSFNSPLEGFHGSLCFREDLCEPSSAMAQDVAPGISNYPRTSNCGRAGRPRASNVAFHQVTWGFNPTLLPPWSYRLSRMSWNLHIMELMPNRGFLRGFVPDFNS